MSPDDQRKRGAGNASKTGIAAFAVAALAVACCAGLPLLAALAGSVALGALFGIGAGVIAVVALTAVVIVRVRRRRSCATAAAPRERRA